MAEQCNTLFCTAEKHEDDWHVDVTGYCWQEPNSDTEQIARVYSWATEDCACGHAAHDDLGGCGTCDCGAYDPASSVRGAR